jgi:hypothetical protein
MHTSIHNVRVRAVHASASHSMHACSMPRHKIRVCMAAAARGKNKLLTALTDARSGTHTTCVRRRYRSIICGAASRTALASWQLTALRFHPLARSSRRARIHSSGQPWGGSTQAPWPAALSWCAQCVRGTRDVCGVSKEAKRAALQDPAIHSWNFQLQLHPSRRTTHG